MNNNYFYITPMIESFSIIPRIAQLYFPRVNWKGDPKGHIGNSDAFFFVVEGECCVFVDGQCHILRTGDLMYMPKGKMRSYFSMCPGLTMYEINFEAYVNSTLWNEAMNIDIHSGRLMVHTENPLYIAKLFEESVRYDMNKDPMYDVIFTANIALIIKEYLIKYAQTKNLTAPFDQVIDYMTENVHKTLRLEDMASKCYMQPTYFVKKFKSAFGDSPIAYFNKLKIYRAMEYLAKGNMSVFDVSRKVGIEDNSYFSKLFKKMCNMTPSEYKMLN